jgi:putative protease
MQKQPELLMPAGNFEKLKYAFAYGADAVYAGLPKFSLRARENQFNKEADLIEAIDCTHKLGKKIYLTTNILPHNRKLDPFMESLKRIHQYQPDGYITADPGLIALMKAEFPDIEIHLSVQANCVNWASAKFWYEQGVKRLILSRELSITEMAEIHRRVPELELEAFVHGSICIAYSGRCLLSNYFNHRDANQGTCTNSCRWQYNIHEQSGFPGTTGDDKPAIQQPYQELDGQYYLEQTDRPGELMPVDEDEYGTYIMNAKDLCAIEHLQALKDAGIVSFKVEGRSKTIYYVSQIARIYREAIDSLDVKAFPDHLLDDLKEVANRGYTTGFLKQNPQEFGQNYDASRPQYNTQKYAGQVLTYDADKQEMVVAVKNKIAVGDNIEVITPDGRFKQSIRTIRKKSGDPLTEVSGGMDQIRINADQPVPPFSLIIVPVTQLRVISD